MKIFRKPPIMLTTIIISLLPLAFFTGCNGGSVNIPTDTKSVSVLKETEDMGQDYIDSMIFVGDSNTAHLVSFGVLSGGTDTDQVWMPNGNTITLDTEICHKSVYCPSRQKYMTIPEAAALEKPEYIILSLGTNGVASMDENKFKFCYRSLIEAIKAASPSTKIMVQSIYPVTSWYKGFSNHTVDRANQWLIELSAECEVKYLDTASVLKDENGALREEYNSYHKDGYHINKEAAEQVIKYIRTHGYDQ